MDSLNFKISKPTITAKQFVKDTNGNYVLSYGISHAKLRNSNQAKPEMMNSMITTVLNKQKEAVKSIQVPLSHKPQVLKILNKNPCG